MGVIYDLVSGSGGTLQLTPWLTMMLSANFSAVSCRSSKYLVKGSLEWSHDTKHQSATVIPNLSLGLSLSSPYLPPDQLDSFMRRMLCSRISRRVLAEHHIALSEAFAGRRGESADGEPHIGIIYTGLNVKRCIDKCTRLLRERPHHAEDGFGESMQSISWPEVVVDGHLDTKFAYIREHLESVIAIF